MGMWKLKLEFKANSKFNPLWVHGESFRPLSNSNPVQAVFWLTNSCPSSSWIEILVLASLVTLVNIIRIKNVYNSILHQNMKNHFVTHICKNYLELDGNHIAGWLWGVFSIWLGLLKGCMFSLNSQVIKLLSL